MTTERSRLPMLTRASTRARWLVLGASLPLGLAVCTPDSLSPDGSGATALLLSPKEATIEGIGSTLALVAKLTDASGAAASASSMRWATRDPQIATVSPTGLVTATGLGTTTIAVAHQSLADSARITVQLKPVVGSPSVTVSPSDATIDGIGNALALQATARAASGEVVQNPSLTWGSLHTNIATVSAAGVVTAVAVGTAQITVAYQSAADTAVIQVKAVAPPPASPNVVVSPSEATIEGFGKTLTLQAVVRTASGDVVSNPTLAWSSLQPNIATVSSGGVVTAVAEGTARIRVGHQDVADTATIHVKPAPPPPPPTIVLSPPEATIQGFGNTLTLQATVRDGNGSVVNNPTIAWSSLQSGIARVSSTGVVTAVAEGTARIIATYQSVADTSIIHVKPAPPPPPPTIVVSPSTASLQGVGSTIGLQATVKTGAGDPVSNPTLSWTSLHPSVATVNSSGLVTAVAQGTAMIRVAYQTVADTATITVTVAPPPPPPSGEVFDSVIANVTIQGDVVVPDGKKWLIGPGVQIAGNLRTVGGTVAMRPGSSLKFLGAKPSEYVGGGMTYGPEFARDIGLWIGQQGVLDIRGTPKTGWNRTGVDPTWKATDEYWITPTDLGDHRPRRWYPGNPIPRIDPRVPAAEIINVTRDIVIEGPGHIHIHSQKPQRIEYVQLRGLGVSRSGGPVLGRYALHLHFSIDGSRGTMIRGVAAIDSRGTVYVPHVSHGVTMIDNVSVNSFAEGLWWDDSDRTNDLVVDRLAIAGVEMPREVSGYTSRHSAIENKGGDRMKISNSVAAGSRGSEQANGFNWPSGADNEGPAMWEFSEGNVAHNNEGAGVRFWFNNRAPHLVSNSIMYRNEFAGIETGAYTNAIRYEDNLLVDNHIVHHSVSKPSESDPRGAYYDRVRVYATSGPAIQIDILKGTPQNRIEWVDCVLQAGPGAPKVMAGIAKTENPFIALFRRCGVTPDDIVFPSPIPSPMEGSNILIEHEDGRRWEVTVTNGTKVVRQLN